MTCPRTIRGEAYTSPSTLVFQATLGELSAGDDGPVPLRDASRWYSVHSAEMGGDGTGVAGLPDGAGDGVAVEAVQPAMRTATRMRVLGIKDPS
ncbi:MAG TPA: hypothetical protein VLU92_09285 [Candidatus Dormibacteraeota bacterium]|nr:hypothetical protein [Candidatus Dormibacteraeota bacterium]